MKQLAERPHVTQNQSAARTNGLALDAPLPVQAKLHTEQANDPLEREAEEIADRISENPSTTSTAIVQEKIIDKPDITPLQKKGQSHIADSDNQSHITQSTPFRDQLAQPQSGSPLIRPVRAEMEAAFGADFGGVRVHTDDRAVALNNALQARAFTQGSDIYFNQGEYHPQTDEGKHLLAHELTHVIQQEGSAQQLVQTKLLDKVHVPVETDFSDLGNVTSTPLMDEGDLDEQAGDVGEHRTVDTVSSDNSGESTSDTHINPNETPFVSSPDSPEKEDEEIEDKDLENTASPRRKEYVPKPGDSPESETQKTTPKTAGRPDASGTNDADKAAKDETDKEGGGEEGSPNADLINFELAEHERWAGSFGEMGTAESDQRAKFILDQAGKGGIQGAVTGTVTGFAMAAVGSAVGKIVAQRLAVFAVSKGAQLTPVPGLGAVIGGVMAVAGLATRDWSATAAAFNRMGTGKGYERLANNLEGLAEVLEVTSQGLDVLAGIMGAISVGMWISAVASGGVLAPLATTLSAIAIGIGIATTAVGILISAAIRPSVAALRALHLFESQGDPTQIEQDGQMLQGATAQVTGAAFGAAAGYFGKKAGGVAGGKINTGIRKIQALRTGGTPPKSAVAGPGPKIHVEVPEAPANSSNKNSRSNASTKPNFHIPDNTATMRTTNRQRAMEQYHIQIKADPSRESGVWVDSKGNYYVMQGDAGSVIPPSRTKGEARLVYHSHPTEQGSANQGLMTQPSQGGGDFAVLQGQAAKARAGKTQSSELHFPTYDNKGNHTAYGATQFKYEPTHPLPLEVKTTLPGGKTVTQRYQSFKDFQNRAGVWAGGDTPELQQYYFNAAETQLRQDVSAANSRIQTLANSSSKPPGVIPGTRIGSEIARQDTQAAANDDRPEYGPAYTTALGGIEPGKVTEIATNPPYPNPPGTMAEVHALMKQIQIAQATQGVLGTTQQALSAQAQEQNAHKQGLENAHGVTKDLQDGRSKHQKKVDDTSKTNAKQKSKSDGALANFKKGAEKKAGITTLVANLRIFQGMAHLFGYLPGSLGRKAHKAKADAGNLISKLNRVNEMDKVKQNVNEGKKTIGKNADRISKTSSEGKKTDEEVKKGQKKIEDLDKANAGELKKTEGVQHLARKEFHTAKNSETKAQTAHDTLLTQLQSWAIVHRQVREKAIQDAIAEYEAKGFKVSRTR